MCETLVDLKGESDMKKMRSRYGCEKMTKQDTLVQVIVQVSSLESRFIALFNH